MLLNEAVIPVARQFFHALDAVGDVIDGAPRIWLQTALAVELRAVPVGELDKVIIIDLAHAPIVTHMATSHPIGFYGVVTLHPITHVEVVDVHLANLVARKPGEMVPVAHLKLHLALVGLPGANPDRSQGANAHGCLGRC